MGGSDSSLLLLLCLLRTLLLGLLSTLFTLLLRLLGLLWFRANSLTFSFTSLLENRPFAQLALHHLSDIPAFLATYDVFLLEELDFEVFPPLQGTTLPVSIDACHTTTARLNAAALLLRKFQLGALLATAAEIVPLCWPPTTTTCPDIEDPNSEELFTFPFLLGGMAPPPLKASAVTTATEPPDFAPVFADNLSLALLDPASEEASSSPPQGLSPRPLAAALLLAFPHTPVRTFGRSPPLVAEEFEENSTAVREGSNLLFGLAPAP